METNTKHFKDLLEAEKMQLEKGLETVARKNPDEAGDWEGVEPELDTDRAEDEEVAESMEQFGNNNATTDQLETRLDEVEMALEKIENGTFGKCSVCGEEIEADRLTANPAAGTCKTHMI